MGAFTQFVNSVRNNGKDWMKRKAPMGLMKVYDDIFKPHFETILPRQSAPKINGQVVSYNTPFQRPFTADLGEMAPFSGPYDHVTETQGAFGREVWQGKLVKIAGPTMDPLQFETEYEDGFLEAAYQGKVSNAAKSIARRVEFEDCNYVFGNASAISQFSNQSIERLLRLDCTSTSHTFGSNTITTLTGTAWSDTTNANPFNDITMINEQMSDLGGDEVRWAFIGNKTARLLDNNTKIAGYAQYHFDVTQTLVGKSLKGVTFKKVLGQNYKENTTNSEKVNYPGIGDERPDTWYDRNKVPMMRHTTGGHTYEWALFAYENIGNTACVKAHVDQKDVMTTYPHSWKENEFGITYSSLSFGFTPMVDDFAKCCVLYKVAEV